MEVKSMGLLTKEQIRELYNGSFVKTEI